MNPKLKIFLYNKALNTLKLYRKFPKERIWPPCDNISLLNSLCPSCAAFIMVEGVNYRLSLTRKLGWLMWTVSSSKGRFKSSVHHSSSRFT